MTTAAQQKPDFAVGDFVYFLYGEDQRDKGRIVAKGEKKDEFIIEICLTKRKSDSLKVESITAKRNQLIPFIPSLR